MNRGVLYLGERGLCRLGGRADQGPSETAGTPGGGTVTVPQQWLMSGIYAASARSGRKRRAALVPERRYCPSKRRLNGICTAHRTSSPSLRAIGALRAPHDRRGAFSRLTTVHSNASRPMPGGSGPAPPCITCTTCATTSASAYALLRSPLRIGVSLARALLPASALPVRPPATTVSLSVWSLPSEVSSVSAPGSSPASYPGSNKAQSSGVGP